MSFEMEPQRCLHRYVGQTVWDVEMPTTGPNRDKILGIRRGVIIDIRTEHLGRRITRALHDVRFDLTGQVERGFFDYGILSAFDMKVLLIGGFLDTQKPNGCYDRIGPPEEESVLWRWALQSPKAAYIQL